MEHAALSPLSANLVSLDEDVNRELTGRGDLEEIHVVLELRAVLMTGCV